MSRVYVILLPDGRLAEVKSSDVINVVTDLGTFNLHILRRSAHFQEAWISSIDLATHRLENPELYGGSRPSGRGDEGSIGPAAMQLYAAGLLSFQECCRQMGIDPSIAREELISEADLHRMNTQLASSAIRDQLPQQADLVETFGKQNKRRIDRATIQGGL
jgi:hypothetical protein